MTFSDQPPATALIAALQQHDLFQSVQEALPLTLANELTLVVLKQDEWLFRQGDCGDALYFVTKGAVRVLQTAVSASDSDKEVQINVLPHGCVFGEISLLTGQPRTTGIQAISDTALIKLTKAGWEILSRTHPEIAARIQQKSLPRLRQAQISRVLSRFLPPSDVMQLDDVWQDIEWHHYPSGSRVYAQGIVAQQMSLVINGRLQIVREEKNGSQTVLGEVGPGQPVSEVALLTGQPRTTAVYAIRDTNLITLSGDTFTRFFQQNPHTILQIAQDIALRVEYPSKPAKSSANRALNLAFVPLTDPAYLDALMQQLYAAFPQNDEVLQLNEHTFDLAFGKTGAALTSCDSPLHAATIAWMDQQETAHDIILLQANPVLDAWTQRCLHQADRIILVANADDDPTVTQIEAAMVQLKLRTRTDLVLLHSSDQLPRNTRRWLNSRNLHAHFHARIGVPADFRRLSRHLTGRATGLVLSAGAARGFAHLGVIRALLDAGIEIDAVGGVSMGALVGAAFAAGYGYDEMLAFVQRYGSPKKLLDYTLPTTSLCKAEKINHMLQDMFGDWRVEDTRLPFFCPSTNLTQGKPHLHTSGALWRAVRASIAIPGVFAPIAHEGNILVDGSVMDSLPIEPMRHRLETGMLIAVNAVPQREMAGQWQFADAVSGWDRLNPFKKRQRVPSLMGTLMHALNANSVYRLRETAVHADIMIQLNTSAYGMMDWAEYKPLIEIGYQEARQQLSLGKRPFFSPIPQNNTSPIPIRPWHRPALARKPL